MNERTESAYRCEMCGLTFDSDWSDAEARAEAEAMFPGLPQEHQKVVCDECYKRLMASEHLQPDGEIWRKRRSEKAV